MKCRFCGKELPGKKNFCGSKECRNLYQQEYYRLNPDKLEVNRFRQAKRNIQNQHKSRYYGDNISDFNHGYNSNPCDKKYVCAECGTEFGHQYKTELVWRNGILIQENIVKQNVTAWGAAVCPNCGLVRENILTDYSFNYRNITIRNSTKREYEEFRRELAIVENPPIIKKYAIYLDERKTHIDFLEELKIIRIMVNNVRIKRKEKDILTTPEEEQICFQAMLNQKD